MTTVIVVLIALAGCGVMRGLLAARSRLDPADRRDVIPIFALILFGVLDDSSLVTGNHAAKIIIPIITAACVVPIFVNRPVSDVHRPINSPVLALGYWVILFAVDLHGNTLSSSYLVGRILAGLVLVVLLAASVIRRVSVQVFAIAASMVVATISITLPVIPHAFRSCDKFKCGVVGNILTGPFTSENYLAIQASFAALLAVYALRGKVRVHVTLLCVLLVLLADSRTSILVLLVSLLVVVGGMRALTRRPRSHRWTGPRAVLLTLPFAISGVALYLITHAKTDSLSNRGNIWITGYTQLGEHKLFGLGIDRWYILQSAGLVPDHFFHSVYLESLFGGGFAALLVFCLWISAVIADQIRSNVYGVVAVTFTAAFLVTGVTEVVWNPLAVDGLTWVAMALAISDWRVADLRETDTEQPLGPEPRRRPAEHPRREPVDGVPAPKQRSLPIS